jgi:hypothetical protein
VTDKPLDSLIFAGVFFLFESMREYKLQVLDEIRKSKEEPKKD